MVQGDAIIMMVRDTAFLLGVQCPYMVFSSFILNIRGDKLMQRFFIEPQKIVHFAHIRLSDHKPAHLVQLSLPKTADIPEGFGLKPISSTTILDFDFIPEADRCNFYSYLSNVSDWPTLNTLFDTLKSSGYTMLYTYDGAHRKVDNFDTFKNAVISKHERRVEQHRLRYLSHNKQ